MNKSSLFPILLLLLIFLRMPILQAQPTNEPDYYKIFDDLGKALKEPQNVYNLRLTGKNMTLLSADIGKLTNLQTLLLDFNKLSILPPEIGKLKNLKILNLSYNELSTLPPELANCTNLVELNLHNNRFKTIPSFVSKMTNLKSLSFFGNQLTIWPTEIKTLTSLRALDLSGNKIQNISSDIKNHPELNTLFLAYNQIGEVPPEIGLLKNLETLTLERNKLKSLPKEMANLTNISKLNLKDNIYEDLPEELYKYLQERNYGESPEIKDLIVQLGVKKEMQRQLAEKEREKAVLTAQLTEKERERERIKLQAEIARKEREREKAQLTATIANKEREKKELEAKAQMERDAVKRRQLEEEAKQKEKEIASLKEIQKQREIAQKAEQEKIKAEKEKAEKEKRLQQVITFSSIIGLLVALAIVWIIYRNAQKQKQQSKIIADEKAKSDALLLNILPKEVADELKEKGITTVHYFENTSVLFADVKGFSALATKVSPQVLIKELNTCFTRFDEIIKKYGLERIKTIGDCYMCTGGVPHRTSTHALDITMAALEIQNWMEDEKKNRNARGEEYWQVRLGIHTGDLVAGVIGKTKFAYDVWGNTVNTAARMESGGEVGRVNITEATYSQIKDFFVFESRGKIEAKNIGFVETFFVLSIKPELSSGGKGLEPNDKFMELKKKIFGEILTNADGKVNNVNQANLTEKTTGN